MTGVTGPYGDSLHYSYESGIGAGELQRAAGRVGVSGSSRRGAGGCVVDGVKVTTLDQTSAGWEWQKSWTSEVLATGDHSLRLVYAGGQVAAALAVSTRSP